MIELLKTRGGSIQTPASSGEYLLSRGASISIVPAGGGAPTLSSPNAINVQSDRATPQVTLTF